MKSTFYSFIWLVVHISLSSNSLKAQAPIGVQVEIQDVTLLNPAGGSGLGSSVIWDEPYLLVGSTQDQSITLYTREAQGWRMLDTVSLVIQGLNSQLSVRMVAQDDFYFVSASGFGDPSVDPNRGMVVIFRRIAGRLVRIDTIEPALLPIDPQDLLANFALFGQGLTINGEWLVITAPFRDSIEGGHPADGAAFVYRLIGEEWVLNQEIHSTFPGSGFFGTSVQLSASGFLAIGQSDNVSEPNVHIYRLVGDKWVIDSIILDPKQFSDQGFDTFGDRLAFSPDGETLVVTDSHGCGGLGSPDPLGEAYVYERNLSSPAPEWNLAATLMPSNNHQNNPCVLSAFFGISVMLFGDTILIGGTRTHGVTDSDTDGAVYRFERSAAGQWRPTETTRFVGELEDGQVLFGGKLVGNSVAFDGSTLFSGPSIGLAGLRIFELNAGQVICTFSTSAPSLEVLRPTGSNTFTVALHDLPPGAPVQLVASARYSTIPGTIMSGQLCLGGQPQRIGRPEVAGPRGDLYLDSLTSGQLLASFSAMSGTSIGLQAWYQDPSALPAFSNATAILCE